MKTKPTRTIITAIIILAAAYLPSAALTSVDDIATLDTYNTVWNTQSNNSSESLPLGGGDIGANVWVQDGQLLVYLDRAGCFDENNQRLKLGRLRLTLSPNPFDPKGQFQQTLKLRQGAIQITGRAPDNTAATIRLWVEISRPVIHIDIDANADLHATAAYESWRLAPRDIPPGVGHRMPVLNLWEYPGKVTTYPDHVRFNDDTVLWHHRNNNDDLVFDKMITQQHLEKVRDQIPNTLRNRTFGGSLSGPDFVPAGTAPGQYAGTDFKAWKLKSQSPSRQHRLAVCLHTDQTDTLAQWEKDLTLLTQAAAQSPDQPWKKHQDWWKQFWDRSHIFINHDKPDPDDPVWCIGRNYQLFRYLLACNAYGDYPTRFNGASFTVDPVYLNPAWAGQTPDYRQWGEGSTAQNQRLVYWPMLKAGDFDHMPSFFNFYRRILPVARLRSKVYWNHGGASFTEHVQHFGLPCAFSYGWNRPEDLDIGVHDNAWVDHQYIHQLDVSMMILEYHRYSNADITPYLPFIEQSVRFFDEHYQFRCKQITGKPLDEKGHLVIYPSTGCETFKNAKNPSDVIAGLQAVLTALLALPDEYAPADKKAQYQAMLQRVPPIPFEEKQGHRTIAPAVSWSHVFNAEIPQLYPVFPFGVFGLGRPDLQVAIDTWKYSIYDPRQKDYICWHQGPIFTARLGLTNEAAEYAIKKFNHDHLKFPAFYGPWDYTPDSDGGGCANVALQEMLLQDNGDALYLFPAWPKDWNVDFKLCAPNQTTVQASLRNGKLTNLNVTPNPRRQNIQKLPQQDY